MRLGMYGYMRLAASNEEGVENEALQSELAGHAEREGFTLERIFIEQIRSNEPAFDCLTDALRASGIRNVIVPSLWHFARLPGLQRAMREHIEQEIGARIWIIQGAQR
ncbi:hypothetical protein ACFXKX_02990 [Streptomyces scopuliridis]|uniref:hypothetical protein n=1 Tax=Streptomyces scopuliridis TaxID=452529 RepID=UPI00369E7B0B